eukprot:358494-Chlamydomonas_euryale.AAC.1
MSGWWDHRNPFCAGSTAGPFDAVVMAAPLEVSGIEYEQVDEGVDPGVKTGMDAGVEGKHVDIAAALSLPRHRAASSEWLGGACRWMRCSGTQAGGGVGGISGTLSGFSTSGGVGGSDANIASGGGRLEKGRRYRSTVTTYVEGTLQAAAFGVEQLPAQRVFLSDGAQVWRCGACRVWVLAARLMPGGAEGRCRWRCWVCAAASLWRHCVSAAASLWRR